MQPRVTQKDIARAAGVSHVAVSLALRGHPSIPEKTRARIQAIAQKLGYAPDPMLASLAAYRQSQRPAAYKSNIAWINRHPRPLDGDMIEYLKGGTEKARELGYAIEVIDLEDRETDGHRLEQILEAKGITGFVLPPCVKYGGELCMDYRKFSAVRLGYSYRHPVLHTIVNAQFRTSFNLFQRVQAAGYERIGILLFEDLDRRTDWNFLGGFRAAQQSLPKARRIEPLYTEREADITDWIRRNRIDAVIGSWWGVPIKALGLGFASLSLRADEKQISGMYQNGVRIGAAAVEHLVSMMHRGETGLPAEPTFLGVPSRWIDGKTLPPKRC